MGNPMSVRVVVRGKLKHETMQKVLMELRRHSVIKVEVEESSSNSITFYEGDKPKVVFLGAPKKADWLGFVMVARLIGGRKEDVMDELRTRGLDIPRSLREKLTEEHWFMVFTAPWCTPCTYQLILCVSIVAQTKARLMVVNIEERPDLAEKFDVKAIPYTLVKVGDPLDGKEVYQQLGFVEWKAFIKRLEEHL